MSDAQFFFKKKTGCHPEQGRKKNEQPKQHQVWGLTMKNSKPRVTKKGKKSQY